jgi:hypothetical protein
MMKQDISLSNKINSDQTMEVKIFTNYVPNFSIEQAYGVHCYCSLDPLFSPFFLYWEPICVPRCLFIDPFLLSSRDSSI